MTPWENIFKKKLEVWFGRIPLKNREIYTHSIWTSSPNLRWSHIVNKNIHVQLRTWTKMSTAALFRISGKPGEKKPKYLSIIDSVVFYSDRTLKKPGNKPSWATRSTHDSHECRRKAREGRTMRGMTVSVKLNHKQNESVWLTLGKERLAGLVG